MTEHVRPPRTAEPLPAFLDGLQVAAAAGRARVATGPPPAPRQLLTDVEIVASGLALPESPVALADGSVLLVEIRRSTLDRITPDGDVETVCYCGGGPNGVALGPDGAAYVCNNGRRHPHDEGGRIERVDLSTGSREVLIEACDGVPLARPNDLVFDAGGAFWFTDFGGAVGGDATTRRHGAILYAECSGAVVTEAIAGLHEPNGIGLSADGTMLYFSETSTGRVYRRRVVGAGQVEHQRGNDPATLLCGLPGLQLFDGLDVDHDGNVCVATLVSGCITVVAPDASACIQLLLPPEVADGLPTNLCFAAADVAYVTLGQTGRLIRCTWPDTSALLAEARARVI